MLHFDLKDLRVFSAVALTGSITKASEYIHLSPSATSDRLSDLEARAGTKLFRRSSRGLRLNPAGEVFAESAKKILFEAEALETRLAPFAHGEEKRITVCCNYNAGVTSFARIHALCGGLAGRRGAGRPPVGEQEGNRLFRTFSLQLHRGGAVFAHAGVSLRAGPGRRKAHPPEDHGFEPRRRHFARRGRGGRERAPERGRDEAAKRRGIEAQGSLVPAKSSALSIARPERERRGAKRARRPVRGGVAGRRRGRVVGRSGAGRGEGVDGNLFCAGEVGEIGRGREGRGRSRRRIGRTGRFGETGPRRIRNREDWRRMKSRMPGAADEGAGAGRGFCADGQKNPRASEEGRGER